MPEPIKHWSLSSLKEKQIKIGAKVISHGRSVAFQMAEAHYWANVPGDFTADCRTVAEAAACASMRPTMFRCPRAPDGSTALRWQGKSLKSGARRHIWGPQPKATARN